jgi:hypothetical protein
MHLKLQQLFLVTNVNCINVFEGLLEQNNIWNKLSVYSNVFILHAWANQLPHMFKPISTTFHLISSSK